MAIETPEQARRAVVFDLDGCLSDDSWRTHMLGMGFDAYNERCAEDRPANMDVLYYQAQTVDEIFVFTGRPGKFRGKTEQWIAQHFPENARQKLSQLVMRGDGDTRRSPELKKAWLAALRHRGIVKAFDDRQDVINAYREAGIEAHQLRSKSGPTGPMPARRAEDAESEPVPPRPDEILEQMAELYRERNAVYGSNFQEAGAILEVLHGPNSKAPAAEILGKVGQGELWHLWTLIMVKMTRFANSELTHDDSIRDIGVYAAMISHIINRKGE